MTRWMVLVWLAAGCGAALVKLEPNRVERLDLGLVDGATTFCPDAPEPPEMLATVKYQDGTVLQTRTTSHRSGTLAPGELAWEAEFGAIDPGGRLRMLADLLAWHDRTLTVRAHVPGRPALAAVLSLTPRFDCGGVVDRAGPAGGAAHRGSAGGSGGSGPRLEVAMAYVETSLHGRLVLVRVREPARGQESYHLVDARAQIPRLTISAAGGAGGPGGNGQSGWDGTKGLDGSSGMSGSTCQDGQDGQDGSRGGDGDAGGAGGPGGDGGDGGRIEIAYPAAFPELAQRLTLLVGGGSAGRGGSGGSGGSGGKGGRGGSGGYGGSSTNHDGQSCSTHSGRDGRDGSDGSSGWSGSNGSSGRAGRPGAILAGAVDVDVLFASEIARGWPIVRGAGPVTTRPTPSTWPSDR